MAYREGNRFQMALLPSAIEEYVGPNDPVRAYDAIVDAMDIEGLGLVIEANKVGNPAYDPKSMLKLLIYGYSYGWRSSRKLERACHHNLSFIWIMGGLKPDHKTIANFRRNNKGAIRRVLRQSARICMRMDLIEGNCLFTDSTKIRGAASISQTKTKEKWQETLEEIDKRIEELLAECDEIDERETGSLVKAAKELQDKQKLQHKIKKLLEQTEREGLEKINGTDTGCVNFKGRQGSHAGYSGHITVDGKNGLIANADVVNKANDSNQFSNQIEQAIENLDKPCITAVADSGYANVENIQETTEKGIDVIVPSQRQALHLPDDSLFGKGKFQYDSENNQYICPEANRLRYSHYSKKKGHCLYRIEKASLCHECPHFGVCTNSKRGRALIRLRDEELREKLEERYASEEGQAIYKKRKEKAELPFGHIKRNLGGGAFLVRGLQGVNAEFSILATCFNIARMITLTGGVSGLIDRLAFSRT
ncbi:IS1182 family transposase [Chloroflexota bacterium]